jgi:hypothetical protein
MAIFSERAFPVLFGRFSMHHIATRYTAITGVQIARVMPGDWRHVDMNDGPESLGRVVGPSYKTRGDLYRSHVDYLLRAGWLRLSIDMPEPRFVASATCGAYAWAMENDEVGIKIYAPSKKEAYQQFADAIEEEFNGRVTIRSIQFPLPL